MTVTGWIVLGGIALVAFLAALLALPRIILRRLEPRLRRQVAATYGTAQPVLEDYAALTLGLASHGVVQARGNGALVLTTEELGWFLFMPQRALRIPRADITEVTTVRSHLGKSYGRDLLLVSFTLDGRPDSMAWLVTDLSTWLTTLGGRRD